MQVGVQQDRALPGTHLLEDPAAPCQCGGDHPGMAVGHRHGALEQVAVVEQRLVEERQVRPRGEGEALGVVVQQRHRAAEGVRLLLVALPHVIALEPRRQGRAQRPAPLRALDGDVPLPVRGGHRSRDDDVGLRGQGMQPGLLGGDVRRRALGVGVDPQREAAPVVGVDPEGRVVRVQHEGEVAHADAERLGGRQGDPAQHLDLALLVERQVAGARLRGVLDPGARLLVAIHLDRQPRPVPCRHAPGPPFYGGAMRLPHGTWPSPITPETLATGQVALDEVRVDGGDTYWLEGRPSEAGRTVLVRHDGSAAHDVLPAPWDARTRVHEYGGGAYAVLDGTVVFSHSGDDRVHRLDAGATEPVPVTPPGPWRFGGLVLHGEHVFAVREDHSRDPRAGQRAGAARPAR